MWYKALAALKGDVYGPGKSLAKFHIPTRHAETIGGFDQARHVVSPPPMPCRRCPKHSRQPVSALRPFRSHLIWYSRRRDQIVSLRRRSAELAGEASLQVSFLMLHLWATTDGMP
jgi:hypothetical protein